jgi:hypothetical protein
LRTAILQSFFASSLVIVRASLVIVRAFAF